MRRVYLLLAVMIACLAGVVVGLERAQENDFPHLEHARLFPLCTGCHEGVPEGDRAQFFPPRTLCEGCHNGTDQKLVSWNGASVTLGNLEFSHPGHEAKEPLDCSTCHTRDGQPRMAVDERRAVPERCFACHEHQAREHLVDARCSQCHVPLARTSFAAARVAALPEPPSHKQPGFLERLHGDLAKSDAVRCQVCHTRERCAACHVNAGQLAEVRAFATRGPNLQLPAFRARYFVPESHRDAEWIQEHGTPARRDIADCSSCHTRDSCMTCHAANAPRAVRSLPTRVPGAAPGVPAVRRAPPTHRTPFFEQEHGALAAASRQTCMGCHARSECEKCHTAQSTGRISSRPQRAGSLVKASGLVQDTSRRVRTSVRHRAGYHPGNFMERHAGAAYNRNLECSNCHETTRFCRDCHEQRGMGTSGRLQAGFHDAQPLWLLNHGKPARQGLESCASCHKQTDCMQCHSSIGSFRISPHGPGFDAKRVQSRNQRLCFTCHLTDPIQTGTP